MGYGAFGATEYSYTLGKGSIGGQPVPSIDVVSQVGNILCFPFTTDLLDVTGNHTIDDGSPALTSTEVYNYGSQGLNVNYGVGNSPRILAASQAHQIPHTSPVTLGFFMMARTYFYTLQLMNSGPGLNSGNSGIQLQSSAGWRFQGAGTTSMGDHREITPAGRFFHIALAISANRTSSPAAEFYINGHPLWTGTLVNANTVNANDNFSFLCDADENASDLANGIMSHCFVSDNLLDRATIRALSDEAFGHASPQWKATV